MKHPLPGLPSLSRRLRLEPLVTLEAKIGADVKEAEAALADAIRAQKLAFAVGEWNRLAAEQRRLASRLVKSLREVRSGLARMRALAGEQRPLGHLLGRAHDWRRVSAALVWPLVSGELSGEIRQIDPAPPGSRRLVQEHSLPDLWPFAQPVEDAPDA